MSADIGIEIPPIVESPTVLANSIRTLKDRQQGVSVSKVSGDGKSAPKTLFVDALCTRIFYVPSMRSFSKASFTAASVVKIAVGKDASKALQQAPDGERGFAVYTHTGEPKSFIPADTETRDKLVQTLAYFVRRSRKNDMDQDCSKVRLYELWLDAERASDHITLTEYSAITRRAGIGLEERLLAQLFVKFDRNNDGLLSFEEFADSYDYLTEIKPLRPLFDACGGSRSELLSIQQTCDFFRIFQGEIMKPEEAVKMMQQYSLDEGSRTLGFREFTAFLFDTSINSWWAPHTTALVQDMTRPLNEYYIATSASTCVNLERSSVPIPELYKLALYCGCRCLEIEVWDSANGPVVCHGNSPSKAPLRDVLDAIKEVAFSASCYPVILALQMFTSEKQRDETLSCIRAALGGSLYTDADCGTADKIACLSPEHLKEKFLLKWKHDDSGDLDTKEGDEVKQLAAGELGKHVYLENYKPGSVSSKYNVCSYAEGKFRQLSRDTVKSATSSMLVRVYPTQTQKGAPSLCNNFSPIAPWAAGVQLVALHYQNYDESLRIYQAAFRRNGQCGYLLKPQASSAKYSLGVTVIAGLSLPRSETTADDKQDMNPFVVVHVDAEASDEKKRTNTIKANGFNPYWNEKFEFVFSNIESAMLSVSVLDEQPSGEREVGGAAIPLECVRLGYRAVPILATRTGEYCRGASIMVHLSLSAV